MSFKTQVALGKNSTLQRQLEDKYVEFKRNLKFNRRRLDVLEEECLTALYKLIVDNKEGKGVENPGGGRNNNTRGADPRQTKSANPRLRREQSCLGMAAPARVETPEQAKRSPTTTSVLNYRQSYSFIKDGLNIDQSRRDRFLRNKKEKEAKAIEIRRGNVHWATKDEVEDRPKTAAVFMPESRATSSIGDHTNMPTRPFTAEPYNSKTNHGNLLNRGQMSSAHTAQNPTFLQKGGLTPATALYQNTGSVVIQTPGETEPNPRTSKQTIVSTRNCDTPDGEVSPIAVRVSITKLNDTQDSAVHRQEHSEIPRLPSRNYKGAPEDELLPLEEDDMRHLETIMDGHGGSNSRLHSSLSKSPRPVTRSGSRLRQAKTPTAEVANVEETAAKTQNFLTSYAKKSKLLGYVVKTRSSSAAPREKSQKTYRSPCITYQELVSIKANIKQQESRTKLLIQRSSKLSKYVDKLATAGDVRRYIQSQNAKQHI